MDNLALHDLKSPGSILGLDQTHGTTTVPVLVSQAPMSSLDPVFREGILQSSTAWPMDPAQASVVVISLRVYE